MSLTFPHAETCPICSSSCDAVEILRRENRLLRFLALGAVWVASSSTRPTACDLETLDRVRELAFESVETASVLDIDADVLSALFSKESR